MSTTNIQQRNPVILPCRCSGRLPGPLTTEIGRATGRDWCRLQCQSEDCSGGASAYGEEHCIDLWNSLQLSRNGEQPACLYDNPQTQQRECWEAGQLQYSYVPDSTPVEECVQWLAAQARHTGLVQSILDLPWVPGRLLGESWAKPEQHPEQHPA